MQKPLTALAIAGFDPSSGAGITADIGVFHRLGLYGLSVVSALTAQNSKGVKDIMPVEGRFIYRQLLCLSEDIAIDCVKLGMLYSESAVKAVSRFISDTNIRIVVIDPVITSSSGKRLIQDNALLLLNKKLLPLATVATPNINEAEIISGASIHSYKDMQEAAREILKTGLSSVVITGGHFAELCGSEQTLDLIFDGKDFHEIKGAKFSGNYHGTGCVYSSALTAYLAQGLNIFKAAQKASQFVRKAIKDSLPLGSGMRSLYFY